MARWDSLFDDLESQLEQELDAERVDLVAEEERLRMGRLSLRDRIVAIATSEVSPELETELRGSVRMTVRVAAIGRDWVAGDVVGDTRVRASCVIPLSAVVAIVPRGDQLAASRGAAAGNEPSASLSARLGLPFVLRDLSRRRVAVDVVGEWGARHGTIDRVGRDHIDLAEHDTGTARRESAVRRTLLLPFGGLVSVRY